jgi:hypothetical protein
MDIETPDQFEPELDPVKDRAERDQLEDELLQTASIGEAARSFLGSELGARMMEKARKVVQDAALDLVQVNPADTKAIMDLQITARSASLFLILINEITSEGDQAYHSLLAMLDR